MRPFKYIKYNTALIASLILMVSCLDDLDRPLENVDPIERVDYSQSQNMVLLIYGAYAELNALQWETVPLIGVRGDDVNPAGDQFPLIETDQYRYDRNFWIYNSTWLNLYSDIIRWHGAIEEIEKYKQAGASATLADQYIAEIKVMRAFKLLQLARLWGSLPIPNQSQPAHLFNVPLSSFDEIMQHLSAQMDEAIPFLPSVHPNQRTDIRGGVTKYTALAVKAMANLELKNWPAVADATGQIISSNLFRLKDDYYQYFKIPGKLDAESLLELQYSDFGQSTGTVTRYNWNFYGPASWTPARAGAGNGWGFWEPSVKYIKFMLDRGEQERLQTTVIFTPAGIADLQADPNYANLPSWISNVSPDGDVFNNHPRYKYLSGKFYLPSTQLTPGRFTFGENNNYKVIRYAEVLLMHAEALVSGANSGVKSATEAVNEVRARVGMAPLSNVTLDNVLDEKFAEFATEWGHRFQDLMRHDRPQELNREGRSFQMSIHRYLPYPLEQQSILPQLRTEVNPG